MRMQPTQISALPRRLVNTYNGYPQCMDSLIDFSRVPENCALSNPNHPPPILPSSPRPYTQLNSGLVVLKPSHTQMSTLCRFIEESPLIESFAFPDQDLLAEVYKGRWKPLPYVYNALKPVREAHRNLWKDEEVKNVHYIFHEKPWHRRSDRLERPPEDDEYHDLHMWWWDGYHSLRSDLQRKGEHAVITEIEKYMAQ